MAVTVCKILMEHVQDTASIEAAMEKENFGADDIIAIVAKTEGNGGVNDFGRILVDRMLRDFLVAKGTRGREGAMKVPIALSGGCPGIIAPHLNIFANVEDPDPDPEAERLAVGIAMSAPIAPEDIGRPAGVEKVAAGTKLAMADAGIDDPADIHYVQSKSPLLTTESIADAKSRGFTVSTEETIESMAIANATAALGIGYALGEFPMPREDQIGHDLEVYSSVASCSSGNEQLEAQIVVVGNKKGAGGRFRIGHSVMKDAIDTHGIYDAIRNAGLPLSDRPHPSAGAVETHEPARHRALPVLLAVSGPLDVGDDIARPQPLKLRERRLLAGRLEVAACGGDPFGRHVGPEVVLDDRAPRPVADLVSKAPFAQHRVGRLPVGVEHRRRRLREEAGGRSARRLARL